MHIKAIKRKVGLACKLTRSPKLPVFVVTYDDDDDDSFAWVLTLSIIVYCSMI